MRYIASVCLVLAILFMAGCGTSAEDKKMITDQGAKIVALEKQVADMTKLADLGVKVTAVEVFLKDPKSKFGTYGTVLDTTKKTTTTTTTTKTTKTTKPPATGKGTPSTTPGTTK